MKWLFPFRFVRLSSIKRLEARIFYLEKALSKEKAQKEKAERELYRIFEARSEVDITGTRVGVETLLKNIDKSFIRRLSSRG